jgi:NitT/TauT family transport system substrate-binding protein
MTKGLLVMQVFAKRVKTLSVFLVAIVLMALTACSDQSSNKDSSDTSTETTPSIPTISLSIDLWPGYYPSIIAKQKGFFEEQGLNVDLNMPGDTNKMLAQFAAGSIDAVAVALGDAILVTRQLPDVKVVLVSDESAGGDAVVSMHQDLSNLNEKSIGTNLGGFGELLIRTMLETQQTSVDSVRLVNVDASDVPKLLSERQLDFGHTWEPYVSEVVAAGGNVVFSSAQTPGLIPDVVAFRGEFVVKHPDSVTQFLNAWFKAQQWWLENLDEGNQLVAEVTGQKAEDISLDGIKLLDRAQNTLTFNDFENKTGLPQVFATYNDFYLNLGILSRPADVQKVLASEFYTASP